MPQLPAVVTFGTLILWGRTQEYYLGPQARCQGYGATPTHLNAHNFRRCLFRFSLGRKLEVGRRPEVGLGKRLGGSKIIVATAAPLCRMGWRLYVFAGC